MTPAEKAMEYARKHLQAVRLCWIDRQPTECGARFVDDGHFLLSGGGRDSRPPLRHFKHPLWAFPRWGYICALLRG